MSARVAFIGKRRNRATAKDLLGGWGEPSTWSVGTAKRWLLRLLEATQPYFRIELGTITPGTEEQLEARIAAARALVSADALMDGVGVNVEPDERTKAAQQKDPHIVKACGCGRTFTVGEWVALEPAYDFCDYATFAEYRHCACESTISVVLETYKVDEAGA